MVMVNLGITSKSSMVKVQKNDAPNSAKFGPTCSKNKQQELVGGYFGRLPCDILHNIALMLPFASIIQLRRSSKFWYKLVTDPKFVDLQLTDALEKSPGYLFTAYDKVEGNCEMYFVEQSGDDLTTSNIFNFSFENYGYFQSSGGLMCVYSRKSKSFCIFNPFIGEEVQVLDVPKFKECSYLHRWCFSYSPSTKEYKILKIWVVASEEDETKTRVFQGYVGAITTLGSNIWSEIQNVPSNLSSLNFTECQGTLFWRKKSGLVSFDIDSEKFHEIPGPPREPVDDGYAVVNANLISMGHTVGYFKGCRLWVLEDKTKGIWIKKYDFSIPPLNKFARGLIAISEDGGDLFAFIKKSTSVFRLDMRCKPFRAIKIKLDKYVGVKDPGMIWFTAPHVRSIVSPVRVMEMGKKLKTGSAQQIYHHFDVMDIEDDLFNKSTNSCENMTTNQD